MAADRGIPVIDFLWSGILAGVPTDLPGDPMDANIGADDGRLLPWLDAGEKLMLAIHYADLDRRPINVLSHSHGLQVVSYAAARGVQFDTAVSVSGPIRRDMQRARRLAKANIRHWIQYADPTGHDKTIIEGEMFDGNLGAVFELPEGQTILTPGTGHSGALSDGPWINRILDAL